MQLHARTSEYSDREDSGFIGLILRNGALFVFALAIAAASTGVRNGFAYDDVLIIVRDDRLHDLADAWRVFTQSYWPADNGSSLYRPLTSLGFVLQWAFGGSPLPFHLVSMMMYGAVSVAVFFLARELFNEKAALLGAAIFAVHPVHVEVVANIVGQAELGSALLVILGVRFYATWLRAGVINLPRVAMICAKYAGALMFKESAVIMPALLLGVHLHTVRGESMKSRLQRGRLLAVGLIATAAAFVVVRTAVLGVVAGGGEPSDVFAGLSLRQRIFTALSVAPEWIRLFLWPEKLSADYSSPGISTATEFDISMIPAMAIIAGLCGIAVYARKRPEAVTFAVAWIAIAMMIPSNVIIVTGVALAERMLFLPSVGVAMLLGYGILSLAAVASDASRRVVFCATVALLAAGIARSALRNPVWRDNETLFRQTVVDAPESWRAHTTLGEMLVSQGKGEGILEMSLGARLSPKNDVKVRYLTANRFHRAKQFEAAVPFYMESIALDPANPVIREAAARCFMEAGKPGEARSIVLEGLRLKPGEKRLHQLLVQLGDTSTVIARSRSEEGLTRFADNK